MSQVTPRDATGSLLPSSDDALRSAYDAALGGRYLRHEFGDSALLIRSYGSR
jgi:hypothetical protein